MVMQNGDGFEAPNSDQLGRYRLIAMLGQGGMGAIRLAVVGGLGGFRKLFVLKILKDELTRDPKFVEMFMHEATLAACLSHPNVIHTVEAGEADGRYFLVMEFLDGQPFSELLRRARREPEVPLPLRVQVICEVLRGLHYVHELCDYDGRALHLVHRDVSPPNVFITYDGQVKLLDFGIAKARDSETTRPGEFKGKVGYAAPEQLRGQPADRRIDIFATGVLLWEAIALRYLVHGKPTRSTFSARLSGTEPRIEQIVEDVDPELAAICNRAMHNDPDQRYQTAEGFRRALQDYLEERGAEVGAADMSRFMRAKFAAERATMHRLIDTQLREGGVSDSVVTSMTAWSRRNSDPPSLPPEPSTGGGESDLGPEPAAPARREAGRLMRSMVALGVVALAVAAVAWRLHGNGRNEAAQSSAPQAIQEREAAPPPLDSPASDQTSTATQTESALPQGVDVPPLEPAAPASPAAPEPTTPARVERPGSQAGVRKREPRGERTRDASRASGATRQGPARDAATMDLDLRNVQKRERRALDVDNPFR